MAAFAPWNCAAVAFLLISLGGRLAAANESSERTSKILKDFADSEKEELAGAKAFELEGKPAEARQVVEISEKSLKWKPQEGRKLSLEMIEKASRKVAGIKYVNTHENASKNLRQPWPREKLHQPKKDSKNQASDSAASLRTSAFNMLIFQSVENKPPSRRVLLDSPDTPTSHDKLNTSSTVSGDETNKIDPKAEVEVHAKGDTTGNDTKKETKGGVDNAANATDILKQAKNISSESDASADASNEYLKHQSCCGDDKKLKACLSGHGAEDLTLFVSSDDSFHISIKSPPFLTAEPTEFELSSGQSKSVQLHLVDLEAVRRANSSEISITYDAGVCSIDVPIENLGLISRQSYFYGFPYSAITTPIVGFGMLFAGVFLFVGIWLCCKYWRGHHRGDGLKYQELEMGHPSVVDHREEEANGWDEVWDDSWEDTEAARSSSRLTETLSSKGLAPRRSNKETWEKRSD